MECPYYKIVEVVRPWPYPWQPPWPWKLIEEIDDPETKKKVDAAGGTSSLVIFFTLLFFILWSGANK